jgi:hypothetical protein
LDELEFGEVDYLLEYISPINFMANIAKTASIIRMTTTETIIHDVVLAFFVLSALLLG